jgi:CHAP domain
MSVESVLARVATIEQAIADPATLLTTNAAATGGTATPATLEPTRATAGTTFAQALQSASQTTPVAPTSTEPTGTQGQQLVRTAESQLGQTEQPPGSNESPAIAMYRTATAGAIPGAPWCAYFASWAARQAGEPLGSGGEGIGSVGQIWSWAQGTGRAIPNGPGVTPQPGDLIVFGGEHVGIVRGVLPDGDIQTIEGNYENKVSANVRTPTEATGYVNMN